MLMIRYVLPATLALALAGCAQGSPSSMVSEDLSRSFSADDFARQASEAPVPVVVHGRAAGLDHKATVQAVTNDLQDSTWGPNPHFVPESSRVAAANESNEYSMVMMINGPLDMSAAQLCADPATRVGNVSVGDETRLSGALCRYDQAISSVEARAANVQSTNDPAFRQLVASVGNELTSPSLVGGPESLDTDD
jgi:hypothetical protein